MVVLGQQQQPQCLPMQEDASENTSTAMSVCDTGSSAVTPQDGDLMMQPPAAITTEASVAQPTTQLTGDSKALTNNNINNNNNDNINDNNNSCSSDEGDSSSATGTSASNMRNNDTITTTTTTTTITATANTNYDVGVALPSQLCANGSEHESSLPSLTLSLPAQQQQQQQQPSYPNNRMGFRHGQISAWAAYHDADSQLDSLESMAKTLLAGSGLNFAECALQELAGRLARTDYPPQDFEALLGDPAVNRNQPEVSSLPGLARVLNTCLDSDATDSDSNDDSLVGEGEASTAAAAAATDAATVAALRERQAWFKRRAQLLTRWQWVSQQLEDVDCRLRAYTDLCSRLSAKSWSFDPGDSASRCVPAPQLLLAGRRRVRLQPPRMQQQQQQQQVGLFRCSCAPPLPGCVLCGGWRNRARPAPSASCQAPLSERAQLLDPACHPSLGPAGDLQDAETAVSSIFRKKRSRQRQLQSQLPHSQPQLPPHKAPPSTQPGLQLALKHRRKLTATASSTVVASDAVSQASCSSSSSAATSSSVAAAAAAAARRQRLQHHHHHPPPLKIPSLTTSALARGSRQQHQQHQHHGFNNGAGGVSGSSEHHQQQQQPQSPPWTPRQLDSPAIEERREIATPGWQLAATAATTAAAAASVPAAAEIRVYARQAKPTIAAAAAAASASGGGSPANGEAPLRLRRIQETPGMSEDLADAAYYMRHRPCEKAEHMRNWGRHLRPSPQKLLTPQPQQHHHSLYASPFSALASPLGQGGPAAAAAAAASSMSVPPVVAFTPGFAARQFPLPCDPFA